MLRVLLRTLRVPIASGSSPHIHVFRLPVYTSSVSFFVSVLGNPVLRKGTESRYLRESNTRYWWIG